MTRRELIEKLRSKGIDKVYNRALSRCLKSELEEYYYTLTESEVMEKYFSFTQINMFLRCNLQYFYRYRMGIKIPPSGVMVQGRNLHKTVELGYTSKIEEGETPPEDMLTDYFFEMFKGDIEQAELKEGEKPEDLEKQGIELVKLHRKELMQKIDPSDVEKEFVVPIKIKDHTYQLKGYIDIETETTIADNKFVSRKPNPNNYKLQLSLYKNAINKPAQIHAVVKTKKPQVIIQDIDIQKEELKRTNFILTKILDSLHKGVFNPSIPFEHWWCSPDWCGYWNICMGGLK